MKKKKTIQKSELKANITHINDIINLFNEFKENKSMELLKNKYNYLDDDNAIIQFFNYMYQTALTLIHHYKSNILLIF